MKVIGLTAFLLLVAGLALSAERPKITGIDHVDFYTTDPGATERFYTVALGLESFPAVEPGQTHRYKVGSQWVGYSPAPDSSSMNRMNHAAFRTSDCEAMRLYLREKGIHVPDSLGTLKTGERIFRVKDPEGNTIEFVQATGGTLMKVHVAGQPVTASNPISRHMIHVGFIVHNRAAEDHFYKDILGFHLYWHGGMTADRDDWVAMQVPDGTDWLEYMLNIKPDPDLRTTGVMNHISLGVKDMKQAAAKVDAAIAQLPAASRPRKDDKPKIGRDGKWQYNIYDPDQTRIELMELTPAEKPCCSEFTGPHPKE